VKSSLVVVGDPVLDVATGADAVGPASRADLCLDGGEERLGCGAVEAGAAQVQHGREVKPALADREATGRFATFPSRIITCTQSMKTTG